MAANHAVVEHAALADDDGATHVHVASTKLYIGIFVALVACTVLTVGLSFIHLGALNLAIAIIIATIKASLVIVFFMHLKSDNRFHALILVSAVLFGWLFLAYTLNDTDRRGEIDHVQGTKINDATGEVAPGGLP